MANWSFDCRWLPLNQKKSKAIKTIKLPKTWLGLPNVQHGSAVPSRNIRLEQNLYANCTTGTTLNDKE